MSAKLTSCIVFLTPTLGLLSTRKLQQPATYSGSLSKLGPPRSDLASHLDALRSLSHGHARSSTCCAGNTDGVHPDDLDLVFAKKEVHTALVPLCTGFEPS
ncbi:uncharacterized protein PSANT_07088 [Moesziomyces antarcticus]|uniref:Secreted protein n=1 Tax=Pseudozyma antarctica TaxID=84753 RepID=A0A5C3FZU3_PSEA2|nr:uncharacterized protein PSANT_06991 [Moesziomyces antarcticus]SPO49313.1 uncharacterized protein PSANT_07005 [Moesziomyces antarcticus]SPO49395.1 uncharacterized protein PSANT_07088 [Moesziomyces antarcticus]